MRERLEDTGDKDFEADKVRAKLSKLSKREKFAELDSLVLDNYIIALSIGKISPIELAPIVTYLKNNKVVQDSKVEETEADIIEDMVEEVVQK